MCAHKRVEIRLFDCCSSMNSITKMLPHLAESLSRCLLTLALTQTVTTLTVTALTALEPPPQTTLLTALIQSLHIHEPSTGLLV